MIVAFTVVLVGLWIIVAFFGGRLLARRYFREPREADIAAMCVAVAFAIGILVPSPARVGGVSATTAATSATPSPPPSAPTREMLAWPPGGRDVSSACRSVKGPLLAGVPGTIEDLRAATNGIFVNDGGLLDNRYDYYLKGWAAQPDLGAPASNVCLIVDGRAIAAATVYSGTQRPDVARSLKKPRLIASGFVIKIPRGAMVHGNHRLDVAVAVRAGSFATVGGTRTVTVFP